MVYASSLPTAMGPTIKKAFAYAATIALVIPVAVFATLWPSGLAWFAARSCRAASPRTDSSLCAFGPLGLQLCCAD